VAVTRADTASPALDWDLPALGRFPDTVVPGIRLLLRIEVVIALAGLRGVFGSGCLDFCPA